MIKLLMLLSEIMVISRLKILNEISMEFMECFKKNMKKKKKGHFLYIRGRTIPITAGSNLLDTT